MHQLVEQRKPTLIVLEATGGLECLRVGLRVQPRRVRALARAEGRWAKYAGCPFAGPLAQKLLGE